MDKERENEQKSVSMGEKPRYYIPSRDKDVEEEVLEIESPISAREYYRQKLREEGRMVQSANYRGRGGARKTGKGGDSVVTWSERLMSQSIVAGVIMLLLFGMNFLDIGIIKSAKEKIKIAVAQDINLTLDEVHALGIRLTDSVKTIFGFENNKPGYEIDEDKTEGGTPEPESFEESPGSGDFRIDEDILNEINSREDPYIKN